MWHHRRHIHCIPATRKVPCCQKDTVHGLCRYGKGIRLFTQTRCLGALRKPGIEEWLMSLIESMYENARGRVCVGCNLNGEIIVKVGILQGSCLSPPSVHHGCGNSLLTVSYRIFLGNVYVHGLIIIVESLE